MKLKLLVGFILGHKMAENIFINRNYYQIWAKTLYCKIETCVLKCSSTMKLFGMRKIWRQEYGVLICEVEEDGRRVQIKSSIFLCGDICFPFLLMYTFILLLLPKTRNVL